MRHNENSKKIKKRHKWFGKEFAGDEYFYWNKIPEKIPENINELNENSKKEIIEDWKKSIWTINVVKEDGEKIKNIRDIPKINKKT
jgi:hypothetical protein